MSPKSDLISKHDTGSIGVESFKEPNPLETGLEYTDEEIRQRVMRDRDFGLDLIYRVKLKQKEEAIRIVAPFIDCAL